MDKELIGVFVILENIVDFDLQRQRKKESEGNVYSGAC